MAVNLGGGRPPCVSRGRASDQTSRHGRRPEMQRHSPAHRMDHVDKRLRVMRLPEPDNRICVFEADIVEWQIHAVMALKRLLLKKCGCVEHAATPRHRHRPQRPNFRPRREASRARVPESTADGVQRPTRNPSTSGARDRSRSMVGSENPELVAALENPMIKRRRRCILSHSRDA